MICIALTLPFPPTVNNLFRDGRGRGRFRSKKYLDWVSNADAAAIEHARKHGKLAQMLGAVEIVIRLGAPDKRRRDCTNYIKPLEDWFVARGLIEGDDSRFVKGVSVAWADMEPGARVEIRPYG